MNSYLVVYPVDPSMSNEISGNFMDDTTREEKLAYYHGQALEELQTRRFVDFLEDEECVTEVDTRKRTTDFLIGDRDVYPDPFKDDHIKSISKSSVRYAQHGVRSRDRQRFVTDVNVHLPPAPEELEEEIEEFLSLEDYDNLDVYHGTGGISTTDGVMLPHLVGTGDMTFEELQSGVKQFIDTYKEIYDNGERAIKKV